MGAGAVNEAVRVATDGLLSTADLAARADFTLGLARVSPSSRTITGPGGKSDVEPRVMQVLVVLADAAGQVVTRETLLQRCWGDVYVGDDSLNRTIGAIRKLTGEIAQGSFAIETIRRAGYRLTAEPLAVTTHPGAAGEHARQPLVSRRSVIAGAAGAAVLGAGGLWWLDHSDREPQSGPLIDRGREALRLDQPGSEQYFQRAATIDPGNAEAWGLLAYALANAPPNGTPRSRGEAAQAAERAARTALQIDSGEPNAQLAMAIVQPLDWYSREDRLRQILASDPDNSLVMRHLGQLLHGVGRCREALAVAERAIAIEPLAIDHQVRRALRLWVLGRVADADQVIDRAIELWPSNPLARLARIMIYAFTGRPRAALAVLDDRETHRTLLSPAAASIWRKSLVAMDARTPAATEAARAAIVEGSKASASVAAWGIPALSAIGEIDAAFAVADGLLLGRGSVIVPQVDSINPRVSRWRNTYGLFTPPTRTMRLDPRFAVLADGLGLTEYWRRRGVGPDRFLFQA